MSESKPVSFYILDKQYQVACPDDERDELLNSVNFLDRKMREIRDSGKVVGADRIAVMAALNITHDLLNNQRESQKLDEVSTRLQRIQSRIDDALHGEE